MKKGTVGLFLALLSGALSASVGCASEAEKALQRGNELRKQQQWEEAITVYSQAIELDPRLSQAYAWRGYIYRALGQYEKALPDANKAIELDPGLADAYWIRGLIHRELRDSDKARFDYNRAIELAPRQASFYGDRARLFQQEASEYSSKAFEATHKRDFRNARLYSQISDASYEYALRDANKAIELDSKNAVHYITRATIYSALRSYRDLIADATIAIDLSSKSDAQKGLAYVIRARGYLGLKEYNRAIADATAALGLDHSDAEAYVTRGEAYWFLRRDFEAEGDFQKAISLGYNRALIEAVKQGILGQR